MLTATYFPRLDPFRHACMGFIYLPLHAFLIFLTLLFFSIFRILLAKYFFFIFKTVLNHCQSNTYSLFYSILSLNTLAGFVVSTMAL